MVYQTTLAVAIETGSMGVGVGVGGGGQGRKGKEGGEGEGGWGKEGNGEGIGSVCIFDTSCAVRHNNQPTNGMPAFHTSLVQCSACS